MTDIVSYDVVVKKGGEDVMVALHPNTYPKDSVECEISGGAVILHYSPAERVVLNDFPDAFFERIKGDGSLLIGEMGKDGISAAYEASLISS